MRQVLTTIGRIVRVVFLLLLLSPVLGPPLYVELAGLVAPGTVVAKREAVQIISNSWTRSQTVHVRYQPADAREPELARIAVTTATYDGLRAGDPVQVRYPPAPWLRRIGNLASQRLVSQPALGSFTARFDNRLLGYCLGIAVFLALLWAWNRWRHWSLALAAFALMVGGLLYLESGWQGPAPQGERIPGRATVRAQHHITRVWQSRRSSGSEATQPYTIVELVFVPAGASDPVLAVDLIDARSVPGLEVGADVRIDYSASDPRWARISAASRTYYWKNLLGAALAVLLLAGLVLVLWWFVRRGKRRSSRLPLP